MYALFVSVRVLVCDNARKRVLTFVYLCMQVICECEPFCASVHDFFFYTTEAPKDSYVPVPNLNGYENAFANFSYVAPAELIREYVLFSVFLCAGTICLCN